MIKPFSPKEARDACDSKIPDFVIQAFNELIAENLGGRYSEFTQSEVEARIKRLKPKDMKFDIRWLDVEPLFRKQGWSVTYDKPGYCESYEPSFKFTAKS